MHNYHDTYGRFPLQQTCCFSHNLAAGRPRIYHSWTVRLLPFLEQQGMYDQLDFNNLKGLSGTDLAIKQQILPAVTCPSDPDSDTLGVGADQASSVNLAPTNYALSSGGHKNSSYSIPGVVDPTYAQYHDSNFSSRSSVRGCFTRSGYSTNIAGITDGTANTILVGEVVGAWCRWQDWGYQIWATMAHPLNAFNGKGIALHGDAKECIIFRSRHPGGAHFLLADGSVQFLNESIDGNTYRDLGDRSDGNPVGQY
jgi:prepilin-type processing-associated H-X9-DG protein